MFVLSDDVLLVPSGSCRELRAVDETSRQPQCGCVALQCGCLALQ